MAIDSPPAGTVSSVDVVRRAVESLNRRDLAGLRQLLTEETVERFPDRTCRGPEEVVGYFSETFTAVPDWNLEIVAIAGEREDVFVRWHLTGTHAGPRMGIAPTGRPLAVDGLDHFVVRDGRIFSNFVIFDQMQFARQIGLLPPDGSRADKGLKAAFNARTRIARRLARRRSA